MKAYKDKTLIKVIKTQSENLPKNTLILPKDELDYYLVVDSEDKELIGKNIYCNDFGYKTFNIDGEQYLFIKNEDILGVL